MDYNAATKSLLFMFIALLCLGNSAFSEYIEGIDTTDENGYGLDSAFKIDPNDPNNGLRGQNVACYAGFSFVGEGHFRYTFDEINIAPTGSHFIFSSNTARSVYSFSNNNFCFVVQKNKDSTFYKVLVINRLGDNRFVYKYGTNTTPNDRTFAGSDYDRSILYKPNNLFCIFESGATQNANSFYLDPPLPNNNHLQGYIIYVQKKDVTIDTSEQINLAQWDSVGFSDTTRFTVIYQSNGEYFNIVAVYEEGRSDFLIGWSRLYKSMSINRVRNGYTNSEVGTSIWKCRGGLSFEFSLPVTGAMLNVFSITGKRMVVFPKFTGNRVLWNTSQCHVPNGLYLLRAEFPDRSVITQPFIIAR